MCQLQEREKTFNKFPQTQQTQESQKLCSSVFHSSRVCAMAFQPTRVTLSASSRMDLPHESSNSCSHLQQANHAECTPLHLSPFTSTVLLLLAPPAEVTTMERFGNQMRVVEPCEVTSHPVFLYSERVHKRSVVLFHALVSHSV